MTVRAPIWPAHWPQDVPSPRQHADGTWMHPSRPEPICERHHLTVKDVMWSRGSGMYRGRWMCRLCAAAKPPTKAIGPSEPDAPPSDDRSPFAVTKRFLERYWQLPYKKWTNAHHQAHTVMMYRQVGWGDAAAKAPVIRNPDKR